MVAGLVYPYEFTRDYGVQLGRAFSRWWRGEKAPEFSGPVGIVDQMKSQLARGVPEGLRMIAIISILLGLFNLLPLPALDGGRLVFLAAEGLSRRRVNQRVENTVHLVGMLALLTFVAWVTFGDIARLFKR
jgi:regulator of sigma E protease